MNFFTIIAILLTATALFSYINRRTIRLPSAIGVLFIALLLSLVLLLADALGLNLSDEARDIMTHINFSKTILQGLLSFLLFAGALQTNYLDLKREKLLVAVLATGGVVLSTLIIGFATYGIVLLVDVPLPPIYCFAFGALISPTDPIAVLATLKHARISKRVSTTIAGESLFNDGMGLVLFLGCLTIAQHHTHPTSFSVTMRLLQVIAGGALLGALLGWLTAKLMRHEELEVDVLMTLALAAGGYSLALALDVSAPIATAAAGLMLGRERRLYDPESRTPGPLALFWEIVDEILNAVTFLLIGFYLLLLPLEPHEIGAGIVGIGAVLFARLASVSAIVGLFRLRQHVNKRTVRTLTWCGIRGGISIALALSVPDDLAREIIVSMTYIIVAFSILVQGTTIRLIIKEETETNAATAGGSHV